MIRTATITWITFRNYGTFLQAYALQHVLRGMGYDNRIIDDKPIIDKKFPPAPPRKLSLYWKIRIRLAKIYHNIIGDIPRKPTSEDLYQKFKNQYLLLDSDFIKPEDLNERYDVFIAGSDQIWYPNEEVFDPYFYLNFAKKKKISYAPSVGASEYPKAFIHRSKPLLERFDHISVREQMGKNLLSSFIDKDIEVVLDPTLLLQAAEWDNVASYPVYKGKYAFLYMLTYNENYLNSAIQDAARQGLKLITVSNEPRLAECVDQVVEAGPSEFVSLIKYADVVYTDSFHGTVFSLLYHKKFVTFKRFSSSSKNNQNSRLENLFNILDIQGVFWGEKECEAGVIPLAYDKNSVDEKLGKYRKLSVEYLNNSILN